jgi:hypothetical protein
MPKITELFAFVIDLPSGEEGVLAVLRDTPAGPTWMPFIGADLKRVRSLVPEADRVAKANGRGYKILRFQLVGEIEKPGMSQ